MPDYLPRPIQDLIGRMLIINPPDRITIDQIKQHPAFRFGLPTEYIVPTPLPIPSILEPIDITTLDPSVLTTLIEIGFDKDQLQQEFAQLGHSMAKVFYSMLTTNLTLESLPWVTPVIEQHPSEVYMQSPQSSLSFGISPEFLPESNPIGSDIFSVTERAQWAAVPQNEYQCEVIQPCYGIHVPLETLMTELQGLLVMQHFQWFHPDDLTLISRRAEDMMYLIVRVERDQELLNMNLFFSQGTQMGIQSLLDLIKAMLQSIV